MYGEKLIVHWLESEGKASCQRSVMEALADTHLLWGLTEITKYGQGMTNHQFRFKSSGRFYLLRLPGEGTGRLIDRKSEADVYSLLKGKGITEEVLYISAETGIKITRFLENVHTCKVECGEEVRLCMEHLRQFHKMKITGSAVFDVYEKIAQYETQCTQEGMGLEGLHKIRTGVLKLKAFMDGYGNENCLCHIDPVADNFLIGENQVYLIDWEYAAMCDPHIDIAMFCIYARYDKASTDKTAEAYFQTGCTWKIKRKIYAYMSACAYLWVLWSRIKQAAGAYFPEYEASQLRLSEKYYKACFEIPEGGIKCERE